MIKIKKGKRGSAFPGITELVMHYNQKLAGGLRVYPNFYWNLLQNSGYVTITLQLHLIC